jgi:iron complex outermembrane receptor protein
MPDYTKTAPISKLCFGSTAHCAWWMRRGIAIASGSLVLLLVGKSALAADPVDEGGLAEITVTAQKYNSTIQDTPISISAVSGEQLQAAGITTVEELAHEVPGISMRSAGPGQTEYEARGLASNGGASPTVGFYLDEVALSPPALAQNGKVVIDPDLYDINRIELLRGPQGTLYGSGSMGGTVKVITNQPKLGTFEGSFQGNLSDTQGGSGNGGGNFMLNLPIGDTLALRVVGTDTYRSGWIDLDVLKNYPFYPAFPNPYSPSTRPNVLNYQIASQKTDSNTEQLYGGRVSLLYKPSEDFSILTNVLYQRMQMGGYDEFDNPPGPSNQAHYEVLPSSQEVFDEVHIYSVTVNANLGFADFTSATAYWDRLENQAQDAAESTSFSVYQAGPGNLNAPPGVTYPQLTGYIPDSFTETDTSQQVSQEIRLTSHDNGRTHWVVGGYYSGLRSTWQQYGATPSYGVPGNPAGIISAIDNPYYETQYALFADGSYKFTPEWTLSAGMRLYRYLSKQYESSWGFYGLNLERAAIPNETEASNNGYTPRVNLSYQPNKDLTTYVSASKGFRPGGANQYIPSFCTPGQSSPKSFDADSVWSYELGEKSKWLDNRLTVNADVYYNAWSNVQELFLLGCGYQYFGNAGNGRSFGPELEISARIADAWTLSVSGAYTDAKITDPNAKYAAFLAGEGTISSCQTATSCTAPILNVAKDTASISLAYSVPVWNSYQLTARVADVYVGPTLDEAYSCCITLPAYSLSNARLTLSADRWSANLFVDNLTNKVAWLTSNNTSWQFNIPGVTRISTNQPRTFGTQINYKF